MVNDGDIIELDSYRRSKEVRSIVKDWEQHVLPTFKENQLIPLIENLKHSRETYFKALNEYLTFLQNFQLLLEPLALDKLPTSNIPIITADQLRYIEELKRVSDHFLENKR
ncbi:hypothetical protein [Bacillus sp. AK128]